MDNRTTSIIGSFSIPNFEPEPPEVDTTDEQAVAKFAESTQWKKQKEFLQTRIEYWQHFLPNGKAISELSKSDRDIAWAVADNVIREINLWVSTVDGVKSGYEE